jgi:hypothetical protein
MSFTTSAARSEGTIADRGWGGASEPFGRDEPRIWMGMLFTTQDLLQQQVKRVEAERKSEPKM